MKKILRTSTIAIVMLISMAISMVHYDADSYLTLNGFSYLAVDSNNAVIFDYDNRDSEVVIPKMLGSYYVSEIGEYAFMNNNSITNISFSDATHLKKIETFAFANCSNITNIIIPTWLNEISVSTFQNCKSLSSVTFYSNITNIPEQAFYKCVSLDNVVLPDSVEYIGRFAFGNCTSLTKVVMSKNVKFIDSTAFKNSPNLTIYGYADSYAQQYATENNIPFVVIPEYEIGDVDLSGRVDVKDATLIQSYIASLTTLTDEQLAVADVNGDSTINVLDATAVQRSLVGM